MTIKEQILKLITEGKIKRNSYRYIANQIYEIVKDEYENGYQKGYKDAERGITRSNEEIYDCPSRRCGIEMADCGNDVCPSCEYEE